MLLFEGSVCTKYIPPYEKGHDRYSLVIYSEQQKKTIFGGPRLGQTDRQPDTLTKKTEHTHWYPDAQIFPAPAAGEIQKAGLYINFWVTDYYETDLNFKV